MTGVSRPLAIKGLTFSLKAAPLMAVSSAIALGDSWCKGKNAYLGKLLCWAVPISLRGMFYPAAPCLVCGCWDHYINNPAILAGSTCWWSLLNWLVCVFPAVDCIRDNWKFMDSFQMLLIHVRHRSGCQKDVLGLWIEIWSVQMGWEISTNQVFLLKHCLQAIKC